MDLTNLAPNAWGEEEPYMSPSPPLSPNADSSSDEGHNDSHSPPINNNLGERLDNAPLPNRYSFLFDKQSQQSFNPESDALKKMKLKRDRKEKQKERHVKSVFQVKSDNDQAFDIDKVLEELGEGNCASKKNKKMPGVKKSSPLPEVKNEKNAEIQKPKEVKKGKENKKKSAMSPAKKEDAKMEVKHENKELIAIPKESITLPIEIQKPKEVKKGKENKKKSAVFAAKKEDAKMDVKLETKELIAIPKESITLPMESIAKEASALPKEEVVPSADMEKMYEKKPDFPVSDENEVTADENTGDIPTAEKEAVASKMNQKQTGAGKNKKAKQEKKSVKDGAKLDVQPELPISIEEGILEDGQVVDESDVAVAAHGGEPLLSLQEKKDLKKQRQKEKKKSAESQRLVNAASTPTPLTSVDGASAPPSDHTKEDLDSSSPDSPVGEGVIAAGGASDGFPGDKYRFLFDRSQQLASTGSSDGFTPPGDDSPSANPDFSRYQFLFDKIQSSQMFQPENEKLKLMRQKRQRRENKMEKGVVSVFQVENREYDIDEVLEQLGESPAEKRVVAKK